MPHSLHVLDLFCVGTYCNRYKTLNFPSILKSPFFSYSSQNSFSWFFLPFPNLCIFPIYCFDCFCLEYAFNICRWTLRNNQSINQSINQSTKCVSLLLIGNLTWLPGPAIYFDWLKLQKYSQNLRGRFNCCIVIPYTLRHRVSSLLKRPETKTTCRGTSNCSKCIWKIFFNLNSTFKSFKCMGFIRVS